MPRTHRLSAATLLPLLLLFLAATAWSKEQWREELPPEQFKRLNQFQRVQYSKAIALFRKDEFKQASAEWEKFRLEFDRELEPETVGYLVFMLGRCQHLAKNRLQAIKTYSEVLDLFPDSVWIAAPSLYFRGMGHFDNGDNRPGLLDMKRMVEDKRYNSHPLAAGALRRLADNHWNKKEADLAVKYWKQTVDTFADDNREEADAARRNVFACYIKDRRYDQIVSWAAPGKDRDDPKVRAWLAHVVWNVAWHGFERDWEKYQDKDKEKKAEDMSAFHDWFMSQKPWFVQAGNQWQWFTDATYFACQRLGIKKEREKVVNDALQFIKEDKAAAGDRDARYGWMVDRLRECGDLVLARLAAGAITDPYLAAWMNYMITGHGENKWAEAAKHLEQIIGMKDVAWAKRARGDLAWVCKDRLGDYEKAVKTYEEIAEPPGTLWSIQECYRRWSKKDKALGTLTEIASMFPDQAARAVYEKGEVHRENGDKEKAIACYRQVMNSAEWKKDPAASAAHQRLEELGIATGGGMTEGE